MRGWPMWDSTAWALSVTSRSWVCKTPTMLRWCSTSSLMNQPAVLAGENEEVFEELLRLNGSSSGARPKIVAQVSTDKKRIIHGQQELQSGFEHWMIKFPSPRTCEARELSNTPIA